ncbi:hypothetical protein ACYPKM_03115 [Pseudomonas aeruginosa]
MLLSSFASLANPLIHNSVEALAEAPFDERNTARIRAELDANYGNPRSTFAAWKEGELNAESPDKWSLAGLTMLEMVGENIQLDPYTPRRAIGGNVYAQDSLFSLDRPLITSYALQREVVPTGYVMAYNGLPLSAGVETSSTRMMKGLPPAGPDGKAIVVCKMGEGASSSYFELSETQRASLREVTGLSFSRCLPPYAQSAYWKARIVDFVDPSGELTVRTDAGRTHD